VRPATETTDTSVSRSMFMPARAGAGAARHVGESPVLSLKARQKWKRGHARIRSESGERYVSIAVRMQAFDGARQYLGRQSAHHRLESWL